MPAGLVREKRHPWEIVVRAANHREEGAHLLIGIYRKGNPAVGGRYGPVMWTK
jgi:hypothetical protein